MKHNIIGTLYDAAQNKAWLGANDFVYRWHEAAGVRSAPSWRGVHKSALTADAAGQPVMSYSLNYRLDAPIEFEHQGPYIEITDMDNLPDRQAVLGETVKRLDQWLSLDRFPRP